MSSCSQVSLHVQAPLSEQLQAPTENGDHAPEPEQPSDPPEAEAATAQPSMQPDANGQPSEVATGPAKTDDAVSQLAGVVSAAATARDLTAALVQLPFQYCCNAHMLLAALKHCEHICAGEQHHDELHVLRQTLSTREAQLEAKAGEQARLEDVVNQLMVCLTCHAPA